eukprot:172326-Pyramimonas_sp.AAC.2
MTFAAWERPRYGIRLALKNTCFLNPSTLHSSLPPTAGPLLQPPSQGPCPLHPAQTHSLPPLC